MAVNAKSDLPARLSGRCSSIEQTYLTHSQHAGVNLSIVQSGLDNKFRSQLEGFDIEDDKLRLFQFKRSTPRPFPRERPWR